MFFSWYSIITYTIWILLRAYQGVMLLYIIISWIPDARSTKIGTFVSRVSHWYLGYFNNILVFGGIDFTPLIGLVLYEYIISLLWV